MGHDSQINSAKQPNGNYNYSEVFKYVKPIIEDADIAIANLEVTLAGPPYKGYPQFSSPDTLAIDAQKAGIDVLCTANNHTLDRRKAGLIRTINILDSLNIKHTGTFVSKKNKQNNTPLIIEKNNIKIAIINYTYGTNGIPVPSPTVVNIINRDNIIADVKKAKQLNVDKIILFIHWGTEYQHQPNSKQTNLADFCFNNGVDIIIGSHPHVIQKSIWYKEKKQFITYSLGNFISNQRKRYTDGGQMIKITLQKNKNSTNIIKSQYLLTWVYTPIINGKKHFNILPCAEYESKPDFFIKKEYFDKMKLFISDSRHLLNSENINVDEYIYK
jgi:poly-gamma-glutamate synthesis protein (capsule biosynthesis protein)